MTGPVLQALFLGFVAAVAVAWVLVLAARLPRRRAMAVAAGLALWLLYVGALSAAGVVRDPSRRPPGIVWVVGPVVLFVIFAVVRSRAGGAVARAVPLAWLLGFQAYRVGVELFLHRLWQDGMVPRMLTWSGANLDVWIGLSAPVMGVLSARGLLPPRLALFWNGLGLLSLANVVARSALTTPGPLHLIAAEVPNRAIGSFPWTFIAGFLAPLAVTLHVLALRRLAAAANADTLPAGRAHRRLGGGG